MQPLKDRGQGFEESRVQEMGVAGGKVIRISRFLFALFLNLTAIGHAVASRRPEVRFHSQKKGIRLTLITIGWLFLNSFFDTQ